MRWQLKARIARSCAQLPWGEEIYKFGQRHLGRLSVDPTARLSAQVEMSRWLAAAGARVSGSRCLEVGTGHVPVVPIGFYLAGAERTTTIDLNRRLDWDLTRETLDWMASHPERLATLYAEDVVSRADYRRRFGRLVELKGEPRKFLEEAQIEYLAPADAASTALGRDSIDCHYSVTVLEHVPGEILAALLTEARRILKPGGFALHFIDPSDHFQHQDASITPINFLKYTDDEWDRIANNQFAYCNRLRASDFLKLISASRFEIVRSSCKVDESSKASIVGGFRLAERFAHYDLDDVCTTSLNVLLKK